MTMIKDLNAKERKIGAILSHLSVDVRNTSSTNILLQKNNQEIDSFISKVWL